jgi:predicted nucleotidyltransferase
MKTVAHIPLADVERKATGEAARRLKAELPVSRVALFGSKARGTGDEGSDIDLPILTSCEVTGPIRGAA